MADTISFDKDKIDYVAGQFNVANIKIDYSISLIMTCLDALSNPNNWSGPIASTAKLNFDNAKTSLEDIKKNMASIYSILSDAATNFGKIKY